MVNFTIQFIPSLARLLARIEKAIEDGAKLWKMPWRM